MIQIYLKQSYLLHWLQLIINALMAALKLYQFLKYVLTLNQTQQLVHLIVLNKIFSIQLRYKFLIAIDLLIYNFQLNNLRIKQVVIDTWKREMGNFYQLLNQLNFHTIIFIMAVLIYLKIISLLHVPIIVLNLIYYRLYRLLSLLHISNVLTIQVSRYNVVGCPK